MEKETQNETQKKDYLLGLRIFWPLFGISLAAGVALVVLGVIDLATTDDIASGSCLLSRVACFSSFQCGR